MHFYYGMPYEMTDIRFILLIGSVLLATIAQIRVNTTFNRFSQVRNHRRLTGAEAARKVLDANGLENVAIEHIRGKLTDHYDPRAGVLRLSDAVYQTDSVAAVSVACHEAGHAMQHAQGYLPLKFRNNIVPIVNFSSKFAWILIIAGIFLGSVDPFFSEWAFNIGIIMFVAVIVFHLVTLPVEFNASSRAMSQMETSGIIDSEEESGAKKVLSAAAMTYVAALAVAVMQLVRLLAIKNRR